LKLVLLPIVKDAAEALETGAYRATTKSDDLRRTDEQIALESMTRIEIPKKKLNRGYRSAEERIWCVRLSADVSAILVK
jgi:hypothetical protein